MYILLLLPVVALEGFAVWRFVYRREVDPRPGLVGLAVLAAGALLGEALLPGAWRWLTFAGATAAQLATTWLVLCLLAAVAGAAYLVLDRPLAPGKAVLALALGCAAACALQTVVAVNTRIDYPFDLEWIEGGLLDHVVRIKAGSPLYQAPDVDYVPCLYAPLYMRIVGLFPYLASSPYWIGRMISMLSILSTGVLVYFAAARVARSAWLGLLVSLCALGGALFAGDWFDLFRVDSLFVLLALASFVLLDRHGERAPGLVAAGALLAGTVFAKQAGAFLVIAALAWMLLSPGPPVARRVVRCAWVGLGGLIVTTVVVAIETADSGALWIQYFVGQLDNYPVKWNLFVKALGRDVLATPGVVLVWGAVIGIASLATREVRSLYREPMVVAGVSLTAIAVLQRSKWGGAENCLLPMLVGCLLLAAHGLVRDDGQGDGDGDRGGRRAAAVLPGAYVLMLIGFLWHMDLAGNRLAGRIPSDADLGANRQLVEYVRGRPGRVVVPTRPHIVYAARGETSFHEMFAVDWAVQHPYPEKILRAIETRSIDSLVLYEGKLINASKSVLAAIRSNYVCRGDVLRWPRDAAQGIAGWQIPPPVFCERKTP